MPTIIKVKGYRLFFVSFDGSKPIHVHVRHGDFSAKVSNRCRERESYPGEMA